MHLISENTR
jgi:hypothetical protein